MGDSDVPAEKTAVVGSGRTITCPAGKGPLAVTLTVRSTGGEGLACVLLGGTRPHVGGTALASPGASVHGESLSSCDLWTSTVPGHKDVQVAAAVARRLCVACGEPVSVAAGVHVDDATAEQIRSLAEGCDAAADAFLDFYLGDGRGSDVR